MSIASCLSQVRCECRCMTEIQYGLRAVGCVVKCKNSTLKDSGSAHLYSMKRKEGTATRYIASWSPVVLLRVVWYHDMLVLPRGIKP